MEDASSTTGRGDDRAMAFVHAQQTSCVLLQPSGSSLEDGEDRKMAAKPSVKNGESSNGDDEEDLTDGVVVPYQTWMDVSSNTTRTAEADDNEDEEDETDESELKPSAAERTNSKAPCRYCQLRFAPDPGENSNEMQLLNWKDIPMYHGRCSEADIKCCGCGSQSSDGALLVGLVKACLSVDATAVELEAFQLMIHRPEPKKREEMLDEEEQQADPVEEEVAAKKKSANKSSDVDKQTVRPKKLDTVRCSVVMTFRFPNLEQQRECRLYVLGTSTTAAMGKRRKTVAKPLPRCWQVLLSMLESDWPLLDQAMERETSGFRQERKKMPSLFPDQLSLENLYVRIPEEECSLEKGKGGGGEEASPTLIGLPSDVLVDNLATFLQARSLDALRSSCRQLHHSLRAVVPGMKLSLYPHQRASLAWMRMRECRQLTERDCLSRAALDADWHRAATGGETVLLRTRGKDDYSIRLDQLWGREVLLSDYDDLDVSRSVARGGLLCDDPGLGKTITVLSLFLQTIGLMTIVDRPQAEAAEQDSSVNDNEAVFRAYWQDDLAGEVRRQILNKLVVYLERQNFGPGQFPTASVRKEIEKDSYRDFSKFEADMKDSIQQYYPCAPRRGRGNRKATSEVAVPPEVVERNCAEARHTLQEIFVSLVEDLKSKELRSAKRSFVSKASAKPNSRMALLLKQQKEEKFLKALIQSSGTLVVIPKVLMEHWKNQIQLHVDFKYICRSKEPLIFDYGRKKKRRRGTTEDDEMTVDKATVLIHLDKTHFPAVFYDMAGTEPLPSAEFLAQFSLVITTTQRFKNEWGNGSFQKQLLTLDEAAEAGKKNKGQKTGSGKSFYLSDKYRASNECSSLLKVHWLRMIVDEGHSMGKGRHGQAIQFASWNSSQRRWAMTGTPTTQSTLADAQIGQFKALDAFLRHEFFTPRCDGEKVWRDYIARGWKDKSLASFNRLKSHLGLLMKRHSKSDMIAEVPPPLYQTTALPMSFIESTTYNNLVCVIQSNLKVTSMEGKTSGVQDSLLTRRNAKLARQALRNVRKCCIGYSRVVPTLTYENYMETLRLIEKHLPGEDALQESLRQFLIGAQEEELTACAVCAIELGTPLLFPCCGALICPECIDTTSNTCVSCEESFDPDDCQRLQPGFDYQWRSNVKLKPKGEMSLPELGNQANAAVNVDLAGGPAPAVAVPNANGNPQNPRRSPARRPKKGDGHICNYDSTRRDGVCLLCRQEHDYCNFMTTETPGRCSTCYREALECPEEESKNYYIVSKLKRLFEERKRLSRSSTLELSKNPVYRSSRLCKRDERPLKAIIFSQFRDALDVVGDRLNKGFGTACVAEYWGTYRTQELHKFTVDPSCFCMLLSKDGSEGLDLSFVTHIIFLEKLWDKSLADQAVARAWRMGATGRVEVETLLAKSTVEETMRDVEGSSRSYAADGGEAEKSQANLQQAKTSYLLKSLKLKTDHHLFAPLGKRVKASTLTAYCENAEPYAKPPPAKKVRFAKTPQESKEDSELEGKIIATTVKDWTHEISDSDAEYELAFVPKGLTYRDDEQRINLARARIMKKIYRRDGQKVRWNCDNCRNLRVTDACEYHVMKHHIGVFADEFKKENPGATNRQVRWGIYRKYDKFMYGPHYDRIPLPYCVEMRIKARFPSPDALEHGYESE